MEMESAGRLVEVEKAGNSSRLDWGGREGGYSCGSGRISGTYQGSKCHYWEVSSDPVWCSIHGVCKNMQLFRDKIRWIRKKITCQNRSKRGGCHKNHEFPKSFFILFDRKGWVLNFCLKFKKYFSTFWQWYRWVRWVYFFPPKSKKYGLFGIHVCQFVPCPPPLE